MVDEFELNAAEEKGIQHAALRQIVHRLGPIPENIAAPLRGLSSEELLDLSVALFDITSYADIERWLTRH